MVLLNDVFQTSHLTDTILLYEVALAFVSCVAAPSSTALRFAGVFELGPVESERTISMQIPLIHLLLLSLVWLSDDLLIGLVSVHAPKYWQH